MLAVHKWNAVYFGQFKSCHEPIFHACLSLLQPGAQPWNPATKCKINGQSKQCIHNLSALTVLTWPAKATVHAELPAHIATMFNQLANADSSNGQHLALQITKWCAGACCSSLPWKYLSHSSYKNELWLYTYGIIHLHIWRAVQFRAHSHASADHCQNSLQAGSCIIFFLVV